MIGGHQLCLSLHFFKTKTKQKESFGFVVEEETKGGRYYMSFSPSVSEIAHQLTSFRIYNFFFFAKRMYLFKHC